MDKEAKKFRRLGFMDIIKEALIITFSTRKSIFSKITIAMILPFCLLVIADIQLGNYPHLENTNQFGSEDQQHQHHHNSLNKWITFGVSYTAHFLFGLALLFPVPIISYAVACAYASKDPNLPQLVHTVFLTKVWKRLLITYLWNFFIQLVCDSVVLRELLQLSIVLFGNPQYQSLGIKIFCVTIVLSLMGYVYINVIWHLARVVSVLEELSGLRALKRNNDLLKGKRWVACALFVAFSVLLSGFQMGGNGGAGSVKGFGCLLGQFLLGLMGLVVQTVLYFVCKSYHRESIDKASLGDQLEGCFGRCGRIGRV